MDFFLPTSIDNFAITAAAAKETVENTFAIQKPSAAIDSQNINTCCTCCTCRTCHRHFSENMHLLLKHFRKKTVRISENQLRISWKPVKNQLRITGESLENQWRISGESVENHWRITGESLEKGPIWPPSRVPPMMSFQSFSVLYSWGAWHTLARRPLQAGPYENFVW